MASSNGRIGGLQRPRPARALASALLSLIVFLIAAAAPSPALSAPPAPPSPKTPDAKSAPKTPKTPDAKSPPPSKGPSPGKKAPGTKTEAVPNILRERARVAMEANELNETRAALLALLTTNPSINAICNLGLVARRLKLMPEAAETLSRCVRAYEAVPIAPRDIERYDELRAELAMTLTMVASVRLITPPKALVTIDGTPTHVTTPDRQIFLTPGPHELVVAGQRRRVDLRAGSTQTLDFPAPKPPPRTPERIDRIAYAGWVGVGAFFVTGAGIITVSEIVRREGIANVDMAESTNGGSTCLQAWRNPGSCNTYLSSLDVADALRSVGIGSLVLSGALIAGTSYYTSRTKRGARVVVGLGSLGVEGAW